MYPTLRRVGSAPRALEEEGGGSGRLLSSEPSELEASASAEKQERGALAPRRPRHVAHSSLPNIFVPAQKRAAPAAGDTRGGAGHRPDNKSGPSAHTKKRDSPGVSATALGCGACSCSRDEVGKRLMDRFVPRRALDSLSVAHWVYEYGVRCQSGFCKNKDKSFIQVYTDTRDRTKHICPRCWRKQAVDHYELSYIGKDEGMRCGREKILRPNGFEAVHFVPAQKLQLVQWGVAVKGDAIFVGFRGSKEMVDWFLNSQPTLLATRFGLHVRGGHYGALHMGDENVAIDVLRVLSRAVRSHQEKKGRSLSKIIFCGHSLGGSYATLVLAEILSLARGGHPGLEGEDAKSLSAFLQMHASSMYLNTFGAPPCIVKPPEGREEARRLWREIAGRAHAYLTDYDAIPRTASRGWVLHFIPAMLRDKIYADFVGAFRDKINAMKRNVRAHAECYLAHSPIGEMVHLSDYQRDISRVARTVTTKNKAVHAVWGSLPPKKPYEVPRLRLYYSKETLDGEASCCRSTTSVLDMFPGLMEGSDDAYNDHKISSYRSLITELELWKAGGNGDGEETGQLTMPVYFMVNYTAEITRERFVGTIICYTHKPQTAVYKIGVSGTIHLSFEAAKGSKSMFHGVKGVTFTLDHSRDTETITERDFKVKDNGIRVLRLHVKKGDLLCIQMSPDLSRTGKLAKPVRKLSGLLANFEHSVEVSAYIDPGDSCSVHISAPNHTEDLLAYGKDDIEQDGAMYPNFSESKNRI
mmetsp:Transcript_18832/g.46183  ORF Transcript_18832/g.46183 Transcript_18832/m.46183 type:complete len:752 (-) Transcript_18832:153-2408(-)